MSRWARALATSGDASVATEMRWQALFGTPAPARLPSLVAQAVAWREQVLAHGDVPPQVARDLRILAHEVRERRRANGSDRLETGEEHDAHDPHAATPPAPTAASRQRHAAKRLAPLPPASSRLLPGTRLVKAHGGRNHVVEVMEDGFRYEDALFGSLSAVAKHITGTHWNGLLFFGLRKRRAYPARAHTRG